MPTFPFCGIENSVHVFFSAASTYYYPPFKMYFVSNTTSIDMYLQELFWLCVCLRQPLYVDFRQ